MLPRIPRWIRQVLITAFVLFAVYYFIFGTLGSSSIFRDNPGADHLSDSLFSTLRSPDPADLDPQTRFSRALVKILKSHKPPISSLTKLDNAGVIGFSDHRHESLQRPDLVPMGASTVAKMRKAHEALVSDVAKLSLPYTPGTRGIVSTAGGALLPVFVISLRMLRRTGSTLPVELFLRESEGDDYLCDDLLPSLNAKCIFLDQVLEPVKKGTFKLEKYQYKIFSVILASFEEVLLLDADSFPVQLPERLFETDPYKSAGLVTWPDFWVSTASAKFYEIQETPLPPTTLRASTEAGQVLVSRRTHSTALLIACYYNYYGPSHFYSLLTQGGPGEGDKETFLAGAAAAGSLSYQVNKPVSVLGYEYLGEQHGIAMLQYDPVADFEGTSEPTPFFVHANFPKMDPNTLFLHDGPALHPNGQHHRLWGNKTSTVKKFGVDIEQRMFEEIKYVACELGNVFQNWKASPKFKAWPGTCGLVEKHIEKVFEKDK